MKKRIWALPTDHLRIARGAMRVAFFLLLGKFAGALKEMAVAYRYGVNDVVDAYQFTQVMANWLPVTLVGVLSVVLIPVLVQVRYQSAAVRQRFVGELTFAAAILGGGLVLLLWFVWPWLLPYIGSGLSGQANEISLSLMRGFAPVAGLIVIIGVCAARLRAQERHINTLLDSLPALSILLWVLAAPVEAGAWPLLWGTVTGYALQAICLYILAQRADQLVIKPLPSLQSEHWPALFHAASIMLIGQVAMSFVGPIDQYAAASLGNNANATLGYATRFISVILGVGAASVGRAALPVLADVQSEGDQARARSIALRWSIWMLLAGFVVAVVAYVFAPFGVALLYERGAFTATDTQRVATLMRWGLLQLPFYFAVLVLVQLLASQKRYAIMASIAVVNFVVKAIVTLTLAPKIGVQGILLATACMYAASFFCYFMVACRPVNTAQQNQED